VTESRYITALREGAEFGRAAADLYFVPDGSLGAKWGGLVFRLHDGDRINIDEDGFVPSLCRAWIEPTTRWSISKSDSNGAYVFFEGSSKTRDTVMRQFAALGIRDVRSGPNLSGGPGDWFVRIDQFCEDITAQLNDIFGQLPDEPASEATSSLRERLLMLSLSRSQEARRSLTSQIDNLQKAAAENSAEAEQLRNLRSDLIALGEELERANAEIASLKSQLTLTSPSTSKTSRIDKELAAAAEAMLPRVNLIGDSIKFIAVELQDRSAVWKILSALDRQDRGQPEGWKSVKGVAHWWERHFSNGQDNQGRIYAKLVETKWQVLVSHKQSQSADLRRLNGY